MIGFRRKGTPLFRNTLLIGLTLCIAHPVLAAEGESKPAADRRPTKIWNRTGPLGETPKHVTDAYPLSDQDNKGGWIKFEPMSDEFEGKELDLNKWTVACNGGRDGNRRCSATRTSPSPRGSCT